MLKIKDSVTHWNQYEWHIEFYGIPVNACQSQRKASRLRSGLVSLPLHASFLLEEEILLVFWSIVCLSGTFVSPYLQLDRVAFYTAIDRHNTVVVSAFFPGILGLSSWILVTVRPFFLALLSLSFAYSALFRKGLWFVRLMLCTIPYTLPWYIVVPLPPYHTVSQRKRPSRGKQYA